MTKSEIFTAAHKLAKTFEGDYTARFILALEIVRSEKTNNCLQNKTQKESFDEWTEKLNILNRPVSKIEDTLRKTEKNLSNGTDTYTRNLRIGKIEALKNYINNNK